MLSCVVQFVMFALPVSVTGATDCALTADVKTLLEATLEGQVPSLLNEVKVIMQPDHAMQIELRDREANVLASKTFNEPYSCAERAQVVAVFASTWDSAVSGGSALADVNVEEAAVVAAPAVPTQAARSASQTVATAPSPLDFRLGAGLAGVSGVNFAQGGQGLGFALEFEARPTPQWGARAELYGLPDRELNFAQGQAVWSRYGGGLGLRAWQPTVIGALSVDMGLHLAYTSVQGRGYAVNSSAGALVPGAKLGVGVDWSLGKPLHLAVDLGLLVWARSEHVTVDASPMTGPSQDLPRADLLMRVLLTWEISNL